MIALIVIVAAVAALVLVAVAARPKMLWLSQRWKYRNPGAVAPSAASYRATRIGAIAGAVIIVAGMAIVLTVSHSANQRLAASRAPAHVPTRAAAAGPATVDQQLINRLIALVKSEAAAGKGAPSDLVPAAAAQLHLNATTTANVQNPGQFDIRSADAKVPDTWCLEVPGPGNTTTTYQARPNFCALTNPTQ